MKKLIYPAFLALFLLGALVFAVRTSAAYPPSVQCMNSMQFLRYQGGACFAFCGMSTGHAMAYIPCYQIPEGK